MKQFKTLLISVLFTGILNSCENKNNDDHDKNNDISKILSVEKITGYVQKGPFLNGTTIVISELTSDLIQTGKNFSSIILDNKGSFEINNIELISQYVGLRANGFYYNEISADNSEAQLTLTALSDLTDKTSLNVNILSHLEKSRVEYLVSNGNYFSDAKHQAQQEILDIFKISKSDIKSSELLDISKEGDDNAILLAISIILQGYRTVAELSELLANISTDLREDGILNSNSLGSELINDAKLLDLVEVRNNIENRYSELGLNTIIPVFEKYIHHFIDSSEFEFTDTIDYPENGTNGPNILSYSITDFPSYDFDYHSTCNLTAVLPEGTFLKVGFYPDLLVAGTVLPDSVIISEDRYSVGSPHLKENSGWKWSGCNNPDYCPWEFYSTESGRTIEIEFSLVSHGGARIEIYENNSIDVTRIKNITW
jgi:hypothetical protein